MSSIEIEKYELIAREMRAAYVAAFFSAAAKRVVALFTFNRATASA